MGTNDFTQETKLLWEDNFSCWECQRNNVVDFHHIVHRHNKHDDTESSPLNVAHLCRRCHDLSDLHSHEKQCKYLTKTANYLYQIGYELTSKDERFLAKYSKEYEI